VEVFSDLYAITANFHLLSPGRFECYFIIVKS
jgi:hypothetical protein